MEYTIIWNGVNDGHDGDLLVQSSRQLEKHVGDLPAHRAKGEREKVYASLPTTRDGALRFNQIIAVSGCSGQGVNSALWELRQRGVLGSVPVPDAHSTIRPPQLYWRRG